MTYGDFEYKRDYSSVKITRYRGSSSSVNIPAQINGVPVTSIGDDAFAVCTSLTSIVIPDSVTFIGDRAFEDCQSLKSITIPNSVTSIGNDAFRRCKSLTRIVIPDSVTTIGNDAFFGCESLTRIVIPDSVTTIGDWTFSSCFSLTNIVIPDSVTSIGGFAFEVCTSLTSIVIPDSVTSIGNDAFRGCESLMSVVIPDSVTTIGDWTFANCSSLTSIVIPNSVTNIGDWAFRGCSSLTSIVIPDSVTSIGNDAFNDCTSLTTIYFPRSLKNSLKSFCNDYGNKIRYYNFPTKFFDKIRRLQNASNLPDDIRTSVKQIETLNYSNKYTGAMNSQINKILDDFITIQELQQKIETNPVINLITLVNGVSQKKITNALKYNDEIAKIKVAAQENLRALTGEKPAAKRQTAPVTNRPANERQSTPVSNISDTDDKNRKIYETFQALNKGRTVTSRPRQNPVPDTANSASVQDNLPNEDFSIEYNPVGITIKKYNGSADFVNIPPQINGLPVTTIGNGAFWNCFSLTSIVIPHSVINIGRNAFWYCTSLTSVVIPDSVTSIGGSAFYGCKSLTSIVIPDSVTTIGGRVFRKCESLTSVVIPHSITSIGDGAFWNCESLKTIYFPRALMDVNGRDNTLKDFRNEYNDKIRYYNTVSEIKELMESPDFEKENVSNSDFKYTRTQSGIHIDEYVGFDTYVPVPEEIEGLPVTSIGYRAFDNENLYKVIIPASVQTIVYAAFVSKQSMHVLFKGESIQLTPQSFIAPKITFYFYNAIIYDSIYPITKNNPKYVIHYDAMDFCMV